jgi:signal transduction histidine kinase/DNA-binding response OmpR family regulator/CHASE3 domain sensor protein
VIGLTIAVLAATAGFLAVERSNSASTQQRLVVSNYQTISLMREALIAVQDAEIGQRNYLLTGNARNLEPYENARLGVDTILRQLDAISAQDPDARRQLALFGAAAAERLSQLNAGVAAYQAYGRDSVQLPGSIANDRATMDRLRQISDDFVSAQALLLTKRLATLRSEQEQADIAGLLVLGGALACLVLGTFIIVRSSGKLEDAQQQLAARSRLLQTTLETLRDPIFVLDPKGTVVAWNETFANLAGWDPAKQPPPTRELLISERSPATRAILRSLGIGKANSERLHSARLSIGGRDFEVSYGEMSDGGAVVRCTDITDKLRDDAALRQGQKMEAIGQLTGGMAHDFNNILQVIEANLDLIKADQAGSSAMQARLQSALAAADRGARLTQQLLAFARRQPLAPQATNVARLVSDLASLLEHALGERITLEFAIADGAWNAKIDPGQLENAILNLAINARDAMLQDGTVRIEVANATLDRKYAALHPDVTPGAYVLVEVSDTGTGMSADVVSRAFDPFFTTKHEGKGTGLGLSMVYGFVQQSSGHIRIDSAIGQGTSVKLYLPRTMELVADQADAELAALPAGHERILVVEDNEDVRQALSDMLSGWGYRVAAAENPDAAAALLDRDSAFDLLFTDVVMPGTMSTMQLAEHARRLRPGIVVLLTSGFARDRIPKDVELDYPMLAKPYRGEELAARIRQLLATRPSMPDLPASEPHLPRPTPAAGRPRRVLVVEDEVVLRMSIAEMLERLDCLVTGAGSGEQAIELLESGPGFDLLLTDLGLPGMSGEELARHVRRTFPSMPVIIASGYGRGEARMEGVQFISKPYSSVDLQQALDHASQVSPVA